MSGYLKTFVLGFLLLLGGSFNSLYAHEQGAHNNGTFDHTHALFDKVLKRHVSVNVTGSFVDYKGLKADMHDLNAYIAGIESLNYHHYNEFSKEQKLAFLINAYNALTIRLILDNYPVSSIKKIGGFFSGPWRIKFFSLFGAKQNLDYIEHGLIRAEFNEPRIHFALVCASKGCPPLRAEAYTADKLTGQLEAAAGNFLSNRDKNRFDSRKGRLYLSKIFQWYGDDFKKKYGSVKRFVSPYLTENSDKRQRIIDPSTKITYLPYDWSLNER